jgi:ParB family chromosome partitioning protein
MTDKPVQRRGLGRGLSALMADVTPTRSDTDDARGAQRRGDLNIPIELVEANPEQPRRHFKREDMDELIASVRERGILQPLIVRNHPTKSDSYQIVAGERRWRAAQQVQLHEVPVLVRDYTDEDVLEIAIIENVQRSDLNAVDEARGYRQLMDRFGHTQEKLAEALSKSRSYIANLMRLLQLPDEVLDMLREEALTVGHARALITAPNPTELARQIVARGLSVREAEKLAKGPAAPRVKKQRLTPQKDADTRALEGDLSATLGLKVEISHKPDGTTGQVTIAYKTMDELDEICRILSVKQSNVFR